MNAKRELGRGEKVLPGLWRLRLPLPWPGVPHCNAWAIQSGDGLVLVDCGLHQLADAEGPGSLSQLELAMGQVGLRLEQVRRLIITHAHSDHWGDAAIVKQISGCEVWMHPNHRHGSEAEADPATALEHRLEIARAGGVPERTIERYLDRISDMPSGIAAAIEPDHELTEGVTVDTDLGTWQAYETPGHAPSHVCLYQPEQRVLISGDHVLGRISLYFDYGWTPDPIDEYMHSLEVVDGLGARLALSGHGKPFTDVHAHIVGARRLVEERLAVARDALDAMPRTALELAPTIFGEQLTPETAYWRLTEVLCVLQHLELEGSVVRETDGNTERFRLKR
ncbi:MAG TPA: MBL fold metallo-hydrolase [Solirubrobacteraceae bacterium]|nr:MBL fold metallo-hydrolase [Solirubrobacteraceae bacterium]